MMTNRAEQPYLHPNDLYPVVQDLSDAEYGNGSSSCCGEVFGGFPLENLLSPMLSPMHCSSMCPCDIGESRAAAEVNGSTQTSNHGCNSTTKESHQDLPTTHRPGKKDSVATVATSSDVVADHPERNLVHPLQRDSHSHNKDNDDVHQSDGTSSSGKQMPQGPSVESLLRRKKLHIRRRSRQLMNLLLVRSNSIGSSTITETSMESQTTSMRFHEKYILTQRMFRGRNSEVWQALDRDYGALHCVKIVMLDFAEDDSPHAELEIHHALMDEVRRLEVSQQPTPDGIVRLVESFEEQRKLYMVLEFLDGVNLLSKCIKDGPMSEREVNRITKSLTESLFFLHNLNVVHTNLEPSNVCLTSGSTTTKLVDFGSAVDLSLNIPHGSHPFGNESYVAPELLLGQDMYSLGIMILFMLTGSSPNMNKLLRGEYEFPSSLSRPAKQFISSLLLVDPSVRMTAAEALEHPWLRVEEKVPHHFRRKTSFYKEAFTSNDSTVAGHGNLRVGASGGGESAPNQGSASTKHHRRLSSLSKGISKLFSPKDQSSTQHSAVAHPNDLIASSEMFDRSDLKNYPRSTSPSTLTVSSWGGSAPQSKTKKHHRRLVTS